jgi:DNA-binding transcriptional MocR family regulator
LYIEKGFWREYINYINIIYNERYNFMASQIKEILGDAVSFTLPGGGLNFYLKLSDNVTIDSKELFYRCRDRGVLITPGVIFHRSIKDGIRHFRLGFSKANNKQILQGLNVIKDIIEGSDRLE